MRIVWFIVFVLLFGAVVHLSLRSHPAIVSVPLIPHPLAVWFDRHDFVKNVVGFGALAFTGFHAFLFDARSASPEKRLIASLSVILFVTVLVVALELAQTELPRRSCEPLDLVAADLGLLLAWLGAATLKRPQAGVIPQS